MLSAIQQTPRYRLAAEELAAAIRAGDFAPGAKMPPDRDLVARLGVSRTTLREAMIALELMGYVVTRFGAGAFVADPLPAADLADWIATLPAAMFALPKGCADRRPDLMPGSRR